MAGGRILVVVPVRLEWLTRWPPLWVVTSVSEIQETRAPFQYPMRRLIVRSREVSKPRDW